MKIKNKTNSKRELMDKLTGQLIQVKPYETIQIGKCLYDKNSFEIVKEKIISPSSKANYTKKRKKRISNTRRLINNGTSN